MKMSICASYKDLPFLAEAKKLGYEAVEPPLNVLAAETESDVRRYAKQREELGLACASFNCMLPWESRLFGEEFSRPALEEYLNRSLSYAAIYGAPLVTLGSSTARRIPDGMPRDEAEKHFCGPLSEVFLPIAQRNGLKIAIEPLRTCETNFMNVCGEIVPIVEAVGSPALGITVDYYQAFSGGESVGAMTSVPNLYHVHLASPKRNRAYPDETDRPDLLSFADALKRAGYTGYISMEATPGEDRLSDVRVAIEVMRSVL